MDEFDEYTRRLSDAHKKWHDKKFAYLKTIIPIQIGLLGLLISLKPDDFLNQTTLNLFLTSLGLIGVGAFCGLIALYYEVAISKRARDTVIDGILRDAGQKPKSKKLSFYTLSNKFFFVCEKLAYICLSISMITLIAYAYYSLK